MLPLKDEKKAGFVAGSNAPVIVWQLFNYHKVVLQPVKRKLPCSAIHI